MGGIENFKALVLLVIFLQFYNGFGFKLNKSSERLDDTELKTLTARNENRSLQYSLENMEGGLDISLAQEDLSVDEIQHIDRKLNEIKELLGTTKLAEFFEIFDLLNKGFNEKKKQSLRRVFQRDVLGSVSNNSETLTKNTFAFFEDLRTTNEGLRETNEGLRETNEALKETNDGFRETNRALRETNKIMKEMYGDTSTALLHVMEVLKSMTTVMEYMNKTMARSQPKSCLELQDGGSTQSGVYTVFLSCQAIKVYCDQTTDGGGWTVFQRRQDGSVDFFRNWEDYRNGFGDLHGEFWLGNDKLHRLLAVKSGYELRVDLGDFDGNTAYARYGQFMVGSENENYVLTAKGYSGDAGDSLGVHRGQQFSTKDRDNDRCSCSCSQRYKGGWWYYNCHNSNLNGLYSTDKQRHDTKNVWGHWKSNYPLKFSEMKFRELM